MCPLVAFLPSGVRPALYLLVDALDVVAVDNPQGLDALDAENFGQLALELLSLDVEPGFLLHVDTRDHWFLPS